MSTTIAEPRTFQKAFAFLVEIEGFKSRGFSEVRGLSWDAQDGVHDLESSNPQLRLKRGKVVGDMDLLDWFNERPAVRRRIVVQLLNGDGLVQQRIGLTVNKFKTYDLSPLDNYAELSTLRVEHNSPKKAATRAKRAASTARTHKFLSAR